MGEMGKIKSIKEFVEYQKELIAQVNQKSRIRICMTGCKALGAEEVRNALLKEIKEQGVETEIVDTGCHLFCSGAPVLVVEPQEFFYQQVSPDDAKDIVSKTLKDGKVITRLLYKDPDTAKFIKKQKDMKFYKMQKIVVLRNCGKIDPTKISDYIQRGGYSALVKVLKELSPQDVIEEVKNSKLRGRGGAGFPTGRKWELGLRIKSDVKYVVCNGDEGDPGAFMDRAIMEGDPHSVIEGMIICAKATESNQGYIYVRAEYPIAVKHLQIAIEQCYEAGLLGKNILGTGFDFDIQIYQGAGAFVCGEATALMRSIEGKRGMPTPRIWRSAVKGLMDRPTILNNVETFANIPIIILQGGSEYAKIGTEKSGGTKAFSLAGKINHTGLVEVPIGTKLSDIIYHIGGGIPHKKLFKAVQTGGPSGGCIPKDLLDLPVDYETLEDAGSMMGSGGMIVIDEDTCIVDVAKFFLQFTQSESCGKCTPCRIGTKRMLEILTRITEGKGEDGDIEKLEELGNMIKDTSLCGLGESAPNPVISTIKYFRDEYSLHIKKICPAKVCKELIKYTILEERCNGCHVCFKNCPVSAISGELKSIHKIDQDKCIKCGICLEVCPHKVGAVIKYSGDWS